MHPQTSDRSPERFKVRFNDNPTVIPFKSPAFSISCSDVSSPESLDLDMSSRRGGRLFPCFTPTTLQMSHSFSDSSLSYSYSPSSPSLFSSSSSSDDSPRLRELNLSSSCSPGSVSFSPVFKLDKMRKLAIPEKYDSCGCTLTTSCSGVYANVEDSFMNSENGHPCRVSPIFNDRTATTNWKEMFSTSIPTGQNCHTESFNAIEKTPKRAVEPKPLANPDNSKHGGLFPDDCDVSKGTLEVRAMIAMKKPRLPPKPSHLVLTSTPKESTCNLPVLTCKQTESLRTMTSALSFDDTKQRVVKMRAAPVGSEPNGTVTHPVSNPRPRTALILNEVAKKLAVIEEEPAGKLTQGQNSPDSEGYKSNEAGSGSGSGSSIAKPDASPTKNIKLFKFTSPPKMSHVLLPSSSEKIVDMEALELVLANLPSMSRSEFYKYKTPLSSPVIERQISVLPMAPIRNYHIVPITPPSGAETSSPEALNGALYHICSGIEAQDRKISVYTEKEMEEMLFFATGNIRQSSTIGDRTDYTENTYEEPLVEFTALEEPPSENSILVTVPGGGASTAAKDGILSRINSRSVFNQSHANSVMIQRESSSSGNGTDYTDSSYDDLEQYKVLKCADDSEKPLETKVKKIYIRTKEEMWERTVAHLAGRLDEIREENRSNGTISARFAEFQVGRIQFRQTYVNTAKDIKTFVESFAAMRIEELLDDGNEMIAHCYKAMLEHYDSANGPDLYFLGHMYSQEQFDEYELYTLTGLAEAEVTETEIEF